VKAQTADPSWAYCTAKSDQSNAKPVLILISKIYTTGGDANGRVEQRLDFREYLHTKLKIDASDVSCYEWATEADAKRLRAIHVKTGVENQDGPPKEPFEAKEVDWRFSQ
jgi:hypothetical protein